MLAGEHLLVDEISLADDSVLERLNSVLEPERCLVIPDQMSMVRSAVDVLRRTKTLILSVATLVTVVLNFFQTRGPLILACGPLLIRGYMSLVVFVVYVSEG